MATYVYIAILSLSWSQPQLLIVLLCIVQTVVHTIIGRWTYTGTMQSKWVSIFLRLKEEKKEICNIKLHPLATSAHLLINLFTVLENINGKFSSSWKIWITTIFLNPQPDSASLGKALLHWTLQWFSRKIINILNHWSQTFLWNLPD